MLPLSLPTPSSSSFSSFPLLLSKIENRTAGNWRSLSLLWPSGFAMPFSSSPDNFLLLFLFAFFLFFFFFSSINSTNPSFWNWIFIWDGPGAPVVFMPPSSHQFSFLFSSLRFSPFSPPVNYLLSVRLGQELHFLPEGGLKKRKKLLCSLESVAVRAKKKRRRSWSGRLCSWRYRTFWPCSNFCRQTRNSSLY